MNAAVVVEPQCAIESYDWIQGLCQIFLVANPLVYFDVSLKFHLHLSRKPSLRIKLPDIQLRKTRKCTAGCPVRLRRGRLHRRR